MKRGKRSFVEYLLRWSSFNDDHDSYEPRGTVPHGVHNIFDDYDSLHQLHHFHKPAATAPVATKRAQLVTPALTVPAAQPVATEPSLPAAQPVPPPLPVTDLLTPAPSFGVGNRSKRKRIPNRSFD